MALKKKKKKHMIKFGAKKKFVSLDGLVFLPSSEENRMMTFLFASTFRNFRAKFGAQMQ